MDDPPSLLIEDLPEDMIDFVKPELEPGERLLWTARSQPRDLTGVPNGGWPTLGMIGCLVLFLVIGCAGPWHSPQRWMEPLLAAVELILLLTAIIAMLVSIDQREAYQTRRDGVPDLTYALTDRRVILWFPAIDVGAIGVRSFYPESITSLRRVEFPDGSGDIYFEFESEDPDEDWQLEPLGLIGVARVAQIESLVRKILIKAGPRGGP